MDKMIAMRRLRNRLGLMFLVIGGAACQQVDTELHEDPVNELLHANDLYDLACTRLFHELVDRQDDRSDAHRSLCSRVLTYWNHIYVSHAISECKKQAFANCLKFLGREGVRTIVLASMEYKLGSDRESNDVLFLLEAAYREDIRSRGMNLVRTIEDMSTSTHETEAVREYLQEFILRMRE